MAADWLWLSPLHIVVWVWLYLWVAALFERPKGCFATTDAKTKFSAWYYGWLGT